MSRRLWLRTTSATLLAVAIALLAAAGWIPAKAWLAQQLLQQAWQQTLVDGQQHRPWPWADHWPIARLSFPTQDKSYIVLQGDAGNVLAFAPGHSPRSGLGKSARDIVISGHRDTHFSILANLHPGAQIELTTTAGHYHFKVEDTRILDSRKTGLRVGNHRELLLVTCWPFAAIVPGGPLRYVVQARRLADAGKHASG